MVYTSCRSRWSGAWSASRRMGAPCHGGPDHRICAWGKEAKVMETFEAVRTMLAVRRYQDRPVPDEVVRRIVDAAHLSASSMNLQPWHFIVVQDKEMLRK